MKMAMTEGRILIKDIDNIRFQQIKSWNLMRWNKAEKLLEAQVSLELLNRLAGMVTLPAHIEAEKQRLLKIEAAVNTERANSKPEPLYDYPVKLKLFDHQVRGCNMALLTFGLISPDAVLKREGK